MVESSTAPVAITSESESAAVACITTESIFFPMRLLNRYIQNLTRMEAHSTPTDSQENAAFSGWNTLIRLSFPSCRPSVSTRKATASDAMYSIRACPKG